jgi:hypothetical protein
VFGILQWQCIKILKEGLIGQSVRFGHSVAKRLTLYTVKLIIIWFDTQCKQYVTQDLLNVPQVMPI